MMKKKIQLGSMLALFFSGVLSAQSVGINTDTPNKSAALHIASFKGEKAVLEAVMSSPDANGMMTVESIKIKNPGKGYKTAPTIVIGGGGINVPDENGDIIGVRAEATATLNAEGGIASVTLTNPGANYLMVPSVVAANQDGDYGFVLPRVALTDRYDRTQPVAITQVSGSSEQDSDGLLVYNTSTTYGIDNVPAWYDIREERWYEAASAYKSPKIAMFNITKDHFNIPTGAEGDYKEFNVPLYKEAVSNLSGVEATNGFQTGTLSINLPPVVGVYIVEVNLMLSTPSNSNMIAAGNLTGHNVAGNVKKLTDADTYTMNGVFTQMDLEGAEWVKPTANQTDLYRKEDMVVSRPGRSFNYSAIYTVNIKRVTGQPKIKLMLGRTAGGLNWQSQNLLEKGSFITVQKIK